MITSVSPLGDRSFVFKGDNFVFSIAWEELKYIRKGIAQLELASCLKFVEWTGETDYIEVTVGIFFTFWIHFH